jgi:hypothetical protein
MNKLSFRIKIDASCEKIYDLMLGISNKSSYEEWTAIFNSSSTFEGTWLKGDKILFVGTDSNGKLGGMVSVIAENIPNQFVSIKHIGLVSDGKEILEGPEVEKWAGGFENYSFQKEGEQTKVLVELDSLDEFAEYMNQTYPLALEKLKEIAER